MPALKSTAQTRGELCEQWAVEYLQAQGLRIVDRRLKILNVEVDLVAQNARGVWILIEVKSLKSSEWLERRLTPRQHQRLRRVALALAEGVPWRGSKSTREVELWLITVGETKSSVQVFQDL